MKTHTFYKKILFLCGFFVTLLFFSCQSTKGGGEALNPVFITNSKKVYPLPTSCIEEPFEAEVIFTGTFASERFSAFSYLSSSAQELSILLFNDFGVSMGELLYNGSEARLNSAYFSNALKAEYVVLDFQNAFYPLPALEKLYKSIGLIFESDSTTSGQTRRLRNKNNIIEEIVISKEKISIKNALRGYTYDLVFVTDN